MIPAKIVRFLERANVGHAATRDARLVPHGHRISGWKLNADGTTMSVFIPATASEHLVESLLDNGQFAVTVEDYPAHETYQFKGRYRGHRAATTDDLQATDRVRERWVRSLRQIAPPGSEPHIRAYVQTPAIAVDFEVHEIYVQTPGPGAGARIMPEQA
jgi:hypothetical protein